MMVRADLRADKPRWAMLIPSMLMEPLAPSMIRKRDNVNEDFPAPVLPTIPTFSVGSTRNETPENDVIDKSRTKTSAPVISPISCSFQTSILRQFSV
jgi:hypothetical protein